MRKFSFGFVLFACVVLCSNGFGATPRSNRGVQSAPTASATPVGRSAVASRGRAATTPTKQNNVVGRVATTQKVINTGTKVASATENTAVSESCRTQYYGCMDSFCMLDNTSGGRCICSDRNAELDSVLAEIQRLDEQSYAIATTGVERVEMGADADAVIAQANAVAQSFVTDTGSKQTEKRRALDLANWTSVIDLDDDVNADISLIEAKTGNALHEVVYDLCTNQIISESPECAKDMGMLKLMYAQQIRSNCTAYENSLKQQKNASAQKILAAEAALREAALEQYRNANKYDLGQCTVEFKKCMISTGGCGSDFSSCATVSAMNDTNSRYSKSKKSVYSIQGATTTIEISASTYDTLVAKKPLCETVTKSCVAVKDKVWDTFLKEVAPQLKSAELIAEDNIRQNCIGSISSCFQTACKDNIDPNDPDGSYDICLTRPDTMLSFCKVPLEACGISMKSPETSNIWNFVVARLASMRVDSCTTQVKECLQSDDRCGNDYTQCVGLDTDTIIRMCPYEKMVGCQKVYGEINITGNAVYDEISNMVQGIMLSIDNNMLDYCQKALDNAMISVCGDTENCDNLVFDEGVGARSLEYKVCKYSNDSSSMDIDYNSCLKGVENITDRDLGYTGNGTQTDPIPYAGVIDGTIYWGSVYVEDDGNLSKYEEYLQNINSTDITEQQKQRISSELSNLQRSVDTAIQTIESDPIVQYCMTGREVQGMRVGDKFKNIGDKSRGGRFPQLTQQMRSVISASALKTAKKNYYAKYDELNEKMLKDYATVGERIATLQGKNALDARREIARQACISFSDASILAMSPEPPKSDVGQILKAVISTGAAVAMSFGTGGVLNSVKSIAETAKGVTGVISAVGGVMKSTAGMSLAAGIGGLSSMAAIDESGGGNGTTKGYTEQLMGSQQNNQWNFKETITSTFEWDTLKCHKCTTSQNCTNTKRPLFGKPWCKDWADPVETCTDTQF